MKKRVGLIALLVQGIAIHSAYAATATDVERERIVVFSRQGEAELGQAIEQLKELYQNTSDRKVRDDLIALMVRKAQYQEALAVCAACDKKGFSESELENLARAARNVKQFPESALLYQELAQRFPKNPNGLLGSALVSVDLKQYEAAKQSIARYEQRFGDDGGLQDAKRYLADQVDPDMVRLGRWQKQLQAEPKNTDLAKRLYLLASKYNLFPLQRELIANYPDVFNAKDILWRDQGEAVTLAKGEATKAQVRDSYEQLGILLEKLDHQHPLYIQTLRDRFVLATRLGDMDAAQNHYQQLILLAEKQPQYVQEAYADLRLVQGSPFEALRIYQQIADELKREKKPLSDNLYFKLANAASDAGYFSDAVAYIDNIQGNPYINDFTRTRRIANPSFDRLYFSRVHLALWRGDGALAQSLLNERLNDKAPGDPWTMLAKSEAEQARARTDDAIYWAERAKDSLSTKDQVYADMRLAEIALDLKDFGKADEIIRGFSDSERETAKDLIKRDNLLRSTRIEASFGLSRRTDSAVEQSDEISQDYKIYMPKTAQGHGLYAHYLEARAPADSRSLIQRRIGVGSALNFYPLNLQLEAGKGIKLNEKNYLALNLDYRLNQYFNFAVNGSLNSAGTPIKAINQGIYAKDFGFSTVYTYSDRLRSGLGMNVMKFDDSNLRKDFYWWGTAETFRHDRWVLTNTLRFDYERNKVLSNVPYYNPASSRSIDFSADLSYIQPMDHNLRLTHHLRGSVGQFSQTDQPSDKKWSVSYMHEWRVGKSIGFSYEVGRKKSIYDGKAEYSNFGNLSFSSSF